MIVRFNLRDTKSDDWTRFWIATKDDVPVERFGFTMWIESSDDYNRMRARCIDQMKWAKAIMKAEADDNRRRAYQVVRDCKSHRAMVNAMNKEYVAHPPKIKIDRVALARKKIMDAIML